MKTIIFLSLLSVMLISLSTSCVDPSIKPKEQVKTLVKGSDSTNYEVITIDGCEYIKYEQYRAVNGGRYIVTHKGNCKYCQQRKKDVVIIDSARYWKAQENFMSE